MCTLIEVEQPSSFTLQIKYISKKQGDKVLEDDKEQDQNLLALGVDCSKDKDW